MTRAIALVMIVAARSAVSAQAVSEPSPGAVVTATELRSSITARDTAAVRDRTVRRVTVAGEYNLTVSEVRRLRRGENAPPDALIHSAITEVYHIVEGRGVLIVGGALVEGKAFDPTGVIVRTLIGPSARGSAIVGGNSQEVGPGDVVVIPPNTPHGFSELLTAEIRYVVVRVDAQRLLQAR